MLKALKIEATRRCQTDMSSFFEHQERPSPGSMASATSHSWGPERRRAYQSEVRGTPASVVPMCASGMNIVAAVSMRQPQESLKRSLGGPLERDWRHQVSRRKSD